MRFNCKWAIHTLIYLKRSSSTEYYSCSTTTVCLHYISSFNVDLHKEIQQLQAAHADTINELEKTRSMLIIQHKINKDYQKEVRSNYKTLEWNLEKSGLFQ